jgi:hypothetical protein
LQLRSAKAAEEHAAERRGFTGQAERLQEAVKRKNMLLLILADTMENGIPPPGVNLTARGVIEEARKESKLWRIV